jgi:ABC-2 type transport system permease protein
VALFIAPLAALAINLGFQVSIRAVTAGHRARLPRWARTLCEVLPSGPAALAMGAARQGRLALAVLWLVPAAGVLAAIGWLWSRALDRTLTTAEGRGERANRATVRGRDLFPRAAGFLPRNRVGAVAAKELRMAWRDPRLRAGYIGLAFPVLLPLVSTQFAFHLGPGAVFFAVLPAFFVGAQATNEFGADGPRYWANVAAGDDLRADLVGKSLARGLIAVAISVPVALAAAAVTGGWVYLPAVAGLLAVILGSTMGVGDILSVRMPVPLPESRSNLWATGDAGQALATVGPGCLSLLLNAVAIGPFAVATFFLADHPAALVLVPLELAVGWSVWRFGLHRAVRRSQGRLPELLETLSRRVSG